MINKPGNKSKPVLILTASLFVLLFVRYLYILEFKKVIPLFNEHDHFVLDFEYFFEMGKQSISCPGKLYCDPDNEGTPVLLLKRNVFHPYPPPAALLFRIFSTLPFAWSYAVWSFLIYAAIAAAFLLYVRCLEGECCIARSDLWFPFILCLAAAPTYLDSSFGNVNSVVLLLCVVFTWLLKREKYFMAGMILSASFWLKLYPVILILTFYKARKKVMLAGSFLMCTLTIFIFSLLFIPVESFKEFFTDITPAYSAQTITHVFNQSLTSFLLRLARGSTGVFFSYDYTLIPFEIRSISYLLILSALIVFCWVSWRHNASSTCISAGLCNLIPLITPIGWGYTFVMLYPSLIYLYSRGIMKTKVSALLYLFCWCALAVPSYHNVEKFNLPCLFKLIYYSRYTISSLLLYCLLIIQISSKRIHNINYSFENGNTSNCSSGQLP
jgi:hypothetical protein